MATIYPKHLGNGVAADNARTWARKESLRLSDDQAGHVVAKALGQGCEMDFYNSWKLKKLFRKIPIN